MRVAALSLPSSITALTGDSDGAGGHQEEIPTTPPFPSGMLAITLIAVQRDWEVGVSAAGLLQRLDTSGEAAPDVAKTPLCHQKRGSATALTVVSRNLIPEMSATIIHIVARLCSRR